MNFRAQFDVSLRLVVFYIVWKVFIPWYEYDRGIIYVVWYVMFNLKIVVKLGLN